METLNSQGDPLIFQVFFSTSMATAENFDLMQGTDITVHKPHLSYAYEFA